MTIGKWSVVWVVVLAAVVLGARSADSWQVRPVPCVLLSGADSAIGDARIVQVDTPEEFVALWRDHEGLPANDRDDEHDNRVGRPQVDFTTHFIVAVFLGETSNCAGLLSERFHGGRGEVMLRYARDSYQTLGDGEAVRPYGFFILERQPLTLRIEEHVSSMQGSDRFELRATFPAPK